MQESGTVAVYFVASPLQYLAARRIARDFEPHARQVLVWYKPGMRDAVDAAEWDACLYMPWPRWEPLPGPFGRHRRLRENIEGVAREVGRCERLVLHSAVFDTEAINYFLRALPARAGAREMHARILPDGLISIRRYPLSPLRRALQRLRRLRRLFAAELSYWCFAGDRIGSDAPFCDRIYVVAGLPHEYPEAKVRVLGPLVEPAELRAAPQAHPQPQLQPQPRPRPRRALVVGQPLVGAGLLAPADLAPLTERVHEWLADRRFDEIDYKPHPKDPHRELHHPDYRIVEPACPLELHLARSDYAAVVGVRSSALLFARQIYPRTVPVVSFGWSKLKFKSAEEERDMKRAFEQCGVALE